METRASYILIGIFLVTAVTSLIGFVVWLAKVEIDRELARYEIFFEGSVSGLNIGSDVRYRGIKIGVVTDIAIDSKDPTHVQVQIETDTRTPIRRGDEASLRLQGITGVAYVDIDGADAESPLITAKPGEPFAVIPSKPSQIEKLFAGAPELLQQTALVMERVSRLLRDENQDHVTRILAKSADLLVSLEKRLQHAERIMSGIEQTITDVSATAVNVRTLTGDLNTQIAAFGGAIRAARSSMERTEQLLAGDVPEMIRQWREAAASITGTAKQAEALLADNRESVDAFTQTSLPELSRLILEMRLLAAGMARVIERLESGGARFLLGDSVPEYDTENR